MRKPNSRERGVLQEFCPGYPEPWEAFVGAGEKTRVSLLDAGWIQQNSNPDYPSEYYEITPAGEAAAYS